MRPLFTTLALLAFVTLSLSAQTLTPDSVKGTWVAKEVAFIKTPDLDKPEMKAQLQKLKNTFQDCRLIFAHTGLFRIEFPNVPANGELVKEFGFLNNQKWSVIANKQTILVGTPQQKLMLVLVKREDEEVFFTL